MGLAHTIARQLAKPKGFIGKIIGFGMKHGNLPINEWTIEQLNLESSDIVLEIGFGPGVSIKLVADIVSEGRIAGIDISKTMLEQAEKRNAGALASGKVELRHGDVSTLPYDENTFDKVFGVQVLYFWDDPLRNLKELKRVMKSEGTIALSILDKKNLESKSFTKTGVFHLYDADDVVRLFHRAGFREINYDTKANHKYGTCICCIARK